MRYINFLIKNEFSARTMIFLIILLMILSLYFYGTRNHHYWSNRNVKHDRPLPLFGNHSRNIFGIKSITEISIEQYNKYPDEKVVGYYRGNDPELIIRDLDIAKNILSVEFGRFYARGLGRDVKMHPLLANLFHADGDTWKLLRQRLTPAFSSGKLKAMFPLVVNCAEKLQEAGETIVKRGGSFEARDLMARFTIEFIGACGFGIQMDTINTENSLLRDLGSKMFNRSWKHLVFTAFWELFPELRKLLNVSDVSTENIIRGIVNNIRQQRNGKPSGRNDFIDLLLDLEAKGKIVGESIEKRNSDGTPIQVEMEMDLKCMVAQVFVFFGAGFETSSFATSYTLHQLAFNPEVQKEIQKDIDQIMLKYNNKLCYEAVAEMDLLNMAFREAMRMFPSLGVLHRVCTRRYTIPEINLTIDPGVRIIIPVQAIQNDEKYFDNPAEFRPQRFSREEMTNRHKYCYLAFGHGPRACVGERLGEMQSLAGLAAVLHKFTVEPHENSHREIELNHTRNVVQTLKEGLYLKLKLRASDDVYKQ